MRITLDEAITHAREIAEKNRKSYKNCPAHLRDMKPEVYTCEKCADEHEQLAEWLEELIEYRCVNRVAQNPEAYQNGYATGVEDFVEEIKTLIKGHKYVNSEDGTTIDMMMSSESMEKKYAWYLSNNQCCDWMLNKLDEIAKQLKYSGGKS